MIGARKVLMKVMGSVFLIGAFSQLLQLLMVFVSPLLLNMVIEFIQVCKKTRNEWIFFYNIKLKMN